MFYYMESGLQVKLAIDHQRFSPAFPGFFTPVSYDETDGLFFFFRVHEDFVATHSQTNGLVSALQTSRPR